MPRRGTTGSVYLDAEYTVLEGPYAKRKVWSMIGLYSTKGPGLGQHGPRLVRGILNSARGLSDKDNSPEAQNARRISGFADLDGIEFVARIDIGTDSNGEDKNDIRQAVTRDHKDYALHMGGHAAAPYAETSRLLPSSASSLCAHSCAASTLRSASAACSHDRHSSHLGEVRSKAKWRRSMFSSLRKTWRSSAMVDLTEEEKSAIAPP